MNQNYGARQFDAQNTQCFNIIQGEYRISDDPRAVICTVLGSCISACITDTVAGIGGMNHFLLPGNDNRRESKLDKALFGVTLMNLLVDGLLRRGARIERMEAMIFGGANTISVPGHVGELNARFAERYLEETGIRLVGGSVGGQEARKLEFRPVSGKTRESLIAIRRA